MKIGPQYKIAKRLGAAIFDKTQTQKFALSEARSKAAKKGKRPSNMSDYGRQFLEKQKLRFTYGITEKQLKKYILTTMSAKDSLNALFTLLETRLDNAVYRAGFAKSRRMARQMVSHGHFLVNGTRVTIPSYQLSTGDVISIRVGSKDGSLFTSLVLAATPLWMKADIAEKTVTVTNTPVHKKEEVHADIASVFEFYSR